MQKSVAQEKSFVLYALSISTFFASLSQNIYTPIIPLIRDSFEVSISWVNFTVSSFIFIIAVIQIVLGTVVDHQNKKRLLLISLLLMGVSAVICAYTNSFTLFTLFRMIQAIGAGIIPLVTISMIAQLFEGEARGSAMGTYQILLTLAPAVSPVVGGFIGEFFGYEGIFLFLLIMTISLLMFIVYLLPSEKQDETDEKQSKGIIHAYKAVFSHYIGTSISSILLFSSICLSCSMIIIMYLYSSLDYYIYL